MQTRLPDALRATEWGREADQILRSCVHCGFCNATCPTYQLLGDELDGPRGRIYLIKNALEGTGSAQRAQLHLDRCLTCLSCETTCPSGVDYSRLLDHGRSFVRERAKRPWHARAFRTLLETFLPYPKRLRPPVLALRALAPLLPERLRRQIRYPTLDGAAPATASTARRMVLLQGCAQSVLAPGINRAAARVFGALGVELVEVPAAGCCGAITHHLSGADRALAFMRRNIDAWWPEIERGAEAVVVTASGCAPTVREYGYWLRHDPDYAERAARVSALVRDPVELIDAERLRAALPAALPDTPVAFHTPCTLQHALGLNGRVDAVLQSLGLRLVPVAEPHLCCGSAGTYSLLQPKLARALLEQKWRHLTGADPALVLTANIGCLLHLRARADRPVYHWLEWLAARLDPGSGGRGRARA